MARAHFNVLLLLTGGVLLIPVLPAGFVVLLETILVLVLILTIFSVLVLLTGFAMLVIVVATGITFGDGLVLIIFKLVDERKLLFILLLALFILLLPSFNE